MCTHVIQHIAGLINDIIILWEMQWNVWKSHKKNIIGLLIGVRPLNSNTIYSWYIRCSCISTPFIFFVKYFSVCITYKSEMTNSIHITVTRQDFWYFTHILIIHSLKTVLPAKHGELSIYQKQSRCCIYSKCILGGYRQFLGCCRCDSF